MARADRVLTVDAEKGFSTIGIAAAAILGFTLQPMIAIADPVALLIIGLLLVVFVVGIVVDNSSELTRGQNSFFELVSYCALGAMVCTAYSAWSEQNGVNRICARLQHVMLFEHRVRKDVPEIYRSMGCKAQSL